MRFCQPKGHFSLSNFPVTPCVLIPCRGVPKRVTVRFLVSQTYQLMNCSWQPMRLTHIQGHRNRLRRRERTGKKRLKKLDKRGGLREEVRHCSFSYFLGLKAVSSLASLEKHHKKWTTLKVGFQYCNAGELKRKHIYPLVWCRLWRPVLHDPLGLKKQMSTEEY